LAVEDLTKAINENPANADAWYNRAVVWFDLRMPELAKKDLEEAYKYNISIETSKRIAEHIIKSGYYKEAEFIYLETLAHYPESTEIYEALASIYNYFGDNEKARNAYDKALKYSNMTEESNTKEEVNEK